MLYLGVDYYPEQWPRERWQEDIRLMKELGVNVVRLGEFAWGLMEPEEGKFDFSLFDDVISLLEKNDIRVILGTPTATPPAWLIEKYPKILPVNENGVRISFGGRRHYCANSDVYHEYTAKIVEKMAGHYGNHPSVIGWQVDNEYGHEGSDKCFCQRCQQAFQSWLKKKYKRLEQLNEHWGTVFWSQTYTDWSQIPVPRMLFTRHNPGLMLDYYRFCSDSILRFHRMQVNILREKTTDQWITHNAVLHEQALNPKDLVKDLDMISFDNYPVWGGLKEPIPPAAIAHFHDLCRGLKKKGFWIMEELSGAQGWHEIGYLPRPGHAKLWTYQAVARGAEAIVYFRWRAARYGTEQFCHGILDHDGKPRRKFDELKLVFQELHSFGDRWNRTRFSPEVAVYYDVENAWAWEIQPQRKGLRFKREFVHFYEPAYFWNAAVDIVGPEDDYEAYKVLIMPLYLLTKPQVNEKLERYVRKGGSLILTYRSGVKDENNIVTEKTLPGELSALAGIEIHEYEAFPEGKENRISMKGLESKAGIWGDIITPITAKTLAVYQNEFYRGRSAVTSNRYGKGNVYYIGTSPEKAFLNHLYRHVFAEAGVKVAESPEGVEVVRRKGDQEEFLAVLNHTEQRQEMKLSEPWKDPLTGEKVEHALILSPLESRVLIR